MSAYLIRLTKIDNLNHHVGMWLNANLIENLSEVHESPGLVLVTLVTGRQYQVEGPLDRIAARVAGE